MSGETILVVDDSAATLDFVVDYILKPNGYQAVVARDGAEGIRKALAAPPDLIILDLEMPKMDGLEVLRGLNSRGLTVPIVLSTAHGSEDIAVEVFRLGVRDYVVKPYEVDEMLAAVEHTLEEKRIKRERDELFTRLAQSNRSLEARLKELSTLYGIGKSVTALLEHEGLLKRIVEAAQFVTGARTCALRLVGSDNQLHIQAALGPIDNSRQLKSDHQARQVMRSRQAALTPTTVAVPLLVGAKLIGVLDVNNDATARHFTDHDTQLLQALADYAAIAIENARLFRELEASKEREKLAIRQVFERYVAPSVVDQLLTSPRMATLGGARQQVAVLFADLRGFTSLSQQFKPEILVRALNHHLSLGAQAVLKNEGTLDKFMGDAIMAFFNAPLLQSDYALRAVNAAVQMQQAIGHSSTTMPLQLRLRFGIGIACGEAVVGNIGTDQLMNFTAIGRCVNLAQRLQENAKGGQILIDQATYEAVAVHVQIRPIGPIDIKGFREPVQVYEVIGLL
jgi:class 3 adenylate cyclase/DNA-binding response OmpR family regulator